MSEYLTLKWGTLKSWNVEGEAALAAFERYAAGGISISAAVQHDTPEQKEAICDLIDAMDIECVWNDWDGEQMSKEGAKRYVREYGQKAGAPVAGKPETAQ